MSDYNIPYGYSVLSYIESTGTQYIDTRFIPKQTTRIVIDTVCTNSNTGFVFGTRTDALTNTYCLVNLNGILRNDFGTTLVNTGFSATSRFTFDLNKRAISINNSISSYSNTHTSQTFTCPSNLTLFACNTNGVIESPASIRFYSCKIYNNGTLVRDFIPVMDPEGVYGLYDQVGAAFYKNLGSGEFVVGEVLYTKPELPIEEVSYENIPSGYSVVSYLKSTGTLYINTGFVPNQDTRVVIKLECHVGTSTNWCFGARTSSTADRYTFGASSSGYYASAYKTTAGKMDAYHNTENPFELDKNKNNTYIKGAIVASATYEEFSPSVPLALFAINTNGSFTKGKLNIYSCKIYDNDILVRDYVPVIDNIGLYGLYDLVNKLFYKNAGTGTFGIGEILYIKPNVIGSGSELNSSIYLTLPNNYLPIQYIENNDGYAYIDTGVYGTLNTSISADVHVVDFITHTYCPIIGFYSSTDSLTINPGTGSTTSRRGTLTISKAYTITENTRNVFENLVSSTKLTGSITGIWGSVTEFVTSGTLWIGLCNGSAARAHTKIYECIIWEGETKVRHFVPCINDEGVCGMWDIVGQLFYGSASSSLFTAGNIISNKYKRTMFRRLNVYYKEDKSFDTSDYLGFRVLEDGFTFSFTNDVEYGIDGECWISLPANTTSEIANTGQLVSIRATITPNSSSGVGTFTINKKCNLEGNPLSLVYGGSQDDKPFTTKTTFPKYALRGLFKNCATIQNANSILWNALKTINLYSCTEMFANCTGLKTAPELPFKSNSSWNYGCYSGMFYKCTGLTTPPSSIPYVMHENACYQMFYGCSKLTKTPAMSNCDCEEYACYQMFYGCSKLTDASNITITGTYSYSHYLMFYNCKALTKPPVISTKFIGNNACEEMFANCTSLTVTPTLYITNGWDPVSNSNSPGCRRMFYKCTALTKAILRVEHTMGYMYYEMFCDCTALSDISQVQLNEVKLSGSGVSYQYSHCYAYMFKNCKSLKTAPALPATTLAESCYKGMFYGCTNLTKGPSLPATTLMAYCYDNMFYGTKVIPDCSNINFSSNNSGGLKGLFAGTQITDALLSNILPINPNTNKYYLPATTLTDYCYAEMFKDCTKLTTAPELPATTLAINCYEDMFSGCTSLTNAPDLPATTLTNGCYAWMFYNCTNLLNAPELPAATLTSLCYIRMLSKCPKINYIRMLATDVSASSCLSVWVEGVSSTGTFEKKAGATLPTGDNGIPSGWTVIDV